MEKSGNKYYIRTYGCQMNKYDSELIRVILADGNYEEVIYPEDANYIFINTCSVRENAENRVLGRLNSMKNLKNKNPELKIGVFGCMVKNHTEIVNHPVVDFIAPPDSYQNLIDWLKEDKKGRIPEVENELYSNIFTSPKGLCSYLSITRGCDYFCTYCVVPYTRGKIRFRNPENIYMEVQNLVDSGIKDITLLGQNINSYDYKGIKFPDIMEEISGIKGLKRISFLTSHPKNVPENLFKVMSKHRNITNYLHLPLQSGSDRILKSMRRGYSINNYLDLVDKARSFIPDLTLTTDFIVGFPGESKNDFNKTLDIVKKLRFYHAYMFAYSKRKGTLAYFFDSEVTDKTKQERLSRLIKLQNRIDIDTSQELSGRDVEIFTFAKSKKGNIIGKDLSGKIIDLNGVAKIGSEYIVNIKRVDGRVPVGKVKKEV